MPRQAKAPKDLNAPKRPLSSYMLFNKQRMPELRADPNHEGKKITELTKVIGAEWKAMTADQKQPFEEDAKQKKEVFAREMNEYKQTDEYATFQTRLQEWKQAQRQKAAADSDDEDGRRPAVRAKALKRPKDPNAPKKPLTGFFIFQTKRRPELKEANPETKHTDLVKMASEEWRGMAAEQKEPYEVQARERKEAYNKELEAYKQSDDYRKFQDALAAWKAAKVAAQRKKTKKQAPAARSPTESASESDVSSDSDDSSERRRPSAAHRRSFSSDSSSDSGSDVPMREKRRVQSSSGEYSSESD